MDLRGPKWISGRCVLRGWGGVDGEDGELCFFINLFLFRSKFQICSAFTNNSQAVNIEHDTRLWRLVTDHPNIFDTHIVTKLNGNDVKFFYDVNTESRAETKS